MSFYPVPSSPAMPDVQLPGADQGAVMVAVPVSALAWPVAEGASGDGRSAMVATGVGKIQTGEPVAWCKVVAVAPAVVRRDGWVQADGRPCDHARLGVLEEQLDAMTGPDTIDRIAAGVRPEGKIKGTGRREMSVAFTLRATLLMTLLPEAGYRAVMATLLGDLLQVPWKRPYAVVSGTVLSRWRTAIGAAPLLALQRLVLEAAVDQLRDVPPDIEVGGGLRIGAIDGTVTRMSDTRVNRAEFGTAGTAGTGYPQIRHLHISDAFTRATFAAPTGPAGGDKAEAEQKLLDRALAEHPQVFTPDRLWLMDRNFPGVPRIAAILATGTHVLIRVKSDIRLDRIGDFAPDGSYLATMSGGGVTLTVRVIEYHVTLAGITTPELFCLITDLHDHEAHPAHLLAAAYRWRWDGSETALREAKSTLHGAGAGTGAMLRSHSPVLIRAEHAAWITATALVHALTRTAATVAAPLSKGPRTGQPVAARDLSFTTARHTAIATIAAGTATASLPAPARAAAHHTALRDNRPGLARTSAHSPEPITPAHSQDRRWLRISRVCLTRKRSLPEPHDAEDSHSALVLKDQIYDEALVIRAERHNAHVAVRSLPVVRLTTPRSDLQQRQHLGVGDQRRRRQPLEVTHRLRVGLQLVHLQAQACFRHRPRLCGQVLPALQPFRMIQHPPVPLRITRQQHHPVPPLQHLQYRSKVQRLRCLAHHLAVLPVEVPRLLRDQRSPDRPRGATLVHRERIRLRDGHAADDTREPGPRRRPASHLWAATPTGDHGENPGRRS
jgi:hypothetical protein